MSSLINLTMLSVEMCIMVGVIGGKLQGMTIRKRSVLYTGWYLFTLHLVYGVLQNADQE